MFRQESQCHSICVEAVMEERSVKAQQYKTFGYVAVGLVFVFAVMMFFRHSANEANLMSSRYYKREIKNGVDGLSDRDLWVEKSTNEIDEIKRQNKKLESQNTNLQKQLDSIQKLVIGLGVHLKAFDGQKENVISSQDVSEYTEPEKQPIVPNFADRDQHMNPLNKLENFVEQRGIVGGAYSNYSTDSEGIQRSENSRVLRNGIKVIKFNNSESEYDLDENFIFAGTYARAVLVGSVTVSAGVGASANPKPVMLRISDTGNLPNNVKGFLKGAIVIGAAYGNLSSESVVIRLERIVKIDKVKGVGIDIPVKGYVAGENGDSDIRGMVFDRASTVARTAAISGMLSGMADYITANNGSAVTFEPNSGLAQFSPQKGAKMLEQGASKGIGNAVEKYADFVIKRAEQLQPVIKIDGGRKVTIVFTESVKASAVHMKKVRRRLYAKKLF